MHLNLQQQYNSPIMYGYRKSFIVFSMWVYSLIVIVKKFPNPATIYKLVQRLRTLKKKFTVEEKLQKLAFVDGRYFFNVNHPGWPAKHFNRIIEIEGLNIVNKTTVLPLQNIRLAMIAITNKCPLNCEHCYEAADLNKKEILSLADHKAILAKFQDAGVSQFLFLGGEPMTRVHDLVDLLKTAKKPADFWLSTSGFNFTEENALLLKNAGLVGVSISLDHHLPEKHNAFRKRSDAYQLVENAAKNAAKAKLVISMSVCVTREYCNEENLMQYLLLACAFGASFVQLLEPRAVGNYQDKDVDLTEKQLLLLHHFTVKMNSNKSFKKLPIVIYHGHRQRTVGCVGAGVRSVYVDTNGIMNACPFCKSKSTHFLSENVNDGIQQLKNVGCNKFAILQD